MARTNDGCGNVESWYFILPNVPRDDMRGIIIRINVSAIKIDARNIMHYSTQTKKDSLCNIYMEPMLDVKKI